MDKNVRGYYVAFEGGEGCGKSTQASLLLRHFRNKRVRCLPHVVKEPGYLGKSDKIMDVLFSDVELSAFGEACLYTTIREIQIKDEIKPAIDNIITVVSDRCYISMDAYQGGGGKVKRSLIHRLNEESTQGYKPDLIFITDINPIEGLALEKKQALSGPQIRDTSQINAEDLEYHNAVNQRYRNLAKENPDRIILLNYKDGEESNHQRVLKEIENRLKFTEEHFFKH